MKSVGVYDVTAPDLAARQAALARAAETIVVYVVTGRTDLDRLTAFVVERMLPRQTAGGS